MEDSEVKNRYEDFLNGFDSLCMSTVDKEGWPLISYAPFVVDDNRSFYVFLSDLAKHTSFLRESGKASVMLLIMVMRLRCALFHQTSSRRCMLLLENELERR